MYIYGPEAEESFAITTAFLQLFELLVIRLSYCFVRLSVEIFHLGIPQHHHCPVSSSVVISLLGVCIRKYSP